MHTSYKPMSITTLLNPLTLGWWQLEDGHCSWPEFK